MKKKKDGTTRLFGKRNTEIRDVEEQVFYQPAKEMSKAGEIIGTAFRGITVFCAMFGILHLFYQSVGLYTGDSDYRYFSLKLSLFIIVAAAAAVFCTLARFETDFEGAEVVVESSATTLENEFGQFEEE